MKGFILGIIFGIVWSNVGFSGMAKMLDKGVTGLQTFSKEAAQ